MQRSLESSRAELAKERTVENRKSYNSKAVVGFILALVAFFFPVGLAGLVGFILGLIALSEIKHTKEKGKGLAIAAIIIGFVWSFGIGIVNVLIRQGY